MLIFSVAVERLIGHRRAPLERFADALHSRTLKVGFDYEDEL